MGNLTLNGATSGQITLAPPAVAGTNTLTLPAATGTVLTTAGGQTVSGNTTVSGTVVMGSPFTMRNKIINGAMVIDQRNAGASVTIPAANTYTIDRWFVVSTAASKLSAQQNAGSVTPPSGYKNYIGITSLSAYSVVAGDAFALVQSIEGYNIADLGFGASGALTVTLSFWVRSSLTGTFGGSLYSNNASPYRSYPFTYTISSANTWEQKTVTITGDTGGSWNSTNGDGLQVRFGLGSGSTYTGGTLNTWQNGNYVQPTGSNSIVANNASTFYVTGVQLEIGTAATPFEYRNYQQELAMCQRYYCKSYDISTVAGTITQNGAVQTNSQASSFNGCCNTAIALPVDMRTAGTVTFYSPGTGTVGKAWIIGGSDYTAQGTTGTRNLNMSTTSGPANVATQMTYHYTITSEL